MPAARARHDRPAPDGPGPRSPDGAGGRRPEAGVTGHGTGPGPARGPVTPPTVVVVGSSILDLASYVPYLPAAGETLAARDFALSFGGKGANQAVMASRLGARAHLVSAVGDDLIGDLTLANLRALGVDAGGVVIVGGALSGVATLWIEPSGENRIVIAPGANGALTPGHVRAVLAGLDRVDAVACQLEVPHDATAAALLAGAERGAVTVLNPAPFAPLGPALLDPTDWLVANLHEFRAIAGDPDGGGDPLPARVAEVADRLGKSLVVTLGPAGALLCDRATGEVAAVPAPRVEAVDTVGAGDAFVGSFVYALVTGLSSRESAAFACACAAATVRRRGTQSAYPDGAELARLRRGHLPS